MTELGKKANEAVTKFIDDRLQKRLGMIEVLAAAFMQQNPGLDPSQCELVEQIHADGKTTWYFRRRELPFFVDSGCTNQIYSYYRENEIALRARIGDELHGFVVAMNDRPQGDEKGYLTLIRPMDKKLFKLELQKHAEELDNRFLVSMSLPCHNKHHNEAMKAVRPDDIVAVRMVRPGDEVAPGVVAIAEKQEGMIAARLDLDGPECRCASLINGHDPGCPFDRK